MAAMPLRQQVIDYVDQLDDEQTLRVITFIETLPRKKTAPAKFKDTGGTRKGKTGFGRAFCHELACKARNQP